MSGHDYYGHGQQQQGYGHDGAQQGQQGYGYNQNYPQPPVQGYGQPAHDQYGGSHSQSHSPYPPQGQVSTYHVQAHTKTRADFRKGLPSTAPRLVPAAPAEPAARLRRPSPGPV
jgi:hypothetical protein